MSTSPLCFDQYVIANVQGSRFLDVGCGHGKWGYLLKKYADPQSDRIHVAGIDIFEPHVDTLRHEGIYDEVHVGDALRLPFEDKAFDTVIACEVLEHLSREDGQLLLQELRRVAKSCFIVTTPNFRCLREGNITLDGFNDYEAHKYIYGYREFKALGFTQVIGLGRLKFGPWRATVAFSSMGFFVPRISRFLMGFWFADGMKRVLHSE